MKTYQNNSHMQATCHSEVGKLKSIIMKPATAAFISEQHIAQHWHALNFLAPPDVATAQREYARFEGLIRDTGATVFTLPQDVAVTMDSVYCRDAAIATDFGMIVLNMAKAARAPEPAALLRQSFPAELPVSGTLRE